MGKTKHKPDQLQPQFHIRFAHKFKQLILHHPSKRELVISRTGGAATKYARRDGPWVGDRTRSRRATLHWDVAQEGCSAHHLKPNQLRVLVGNLAPLLEGARKRCEDGGWGGERGEKRDVAGRGRRYARGTISTRFKDGVYALNPNRAILGQSFSTSLIRFCLHCLAPLQQGKLETGSHLQSSFF